jgi:hypothetical protein
MDLKPYKTMTHRPSVGDLNLLLEQAGNCRSWRELKEIAVSCLRQPTVARRREVVSDLKRMFFGDEADRLPLCEQPLVKAWAIAPGTREKRELLATELFRSRPIADEFIRLLIYPKLQHHEKNLFGVLGERLAKGEVLAFVGERLPDISDVTLAKTARVLHEMLVELGLLRYEGCGGHRILRVNYYEPSSFGWLYAVHREFDDLDSRKRTESYFLSESLTTKRFLMNRETVVFRLNQAVTSGWMERESFGGEPVFRLKHKGIDSFIAAYKTGNPG